VREGMSALGWYCKILYALLYNKDWPGSVLLAPGSDTPKFSRKLPHQIFFPVIDLITGASATSSDC
jgi:hypothetical protein